MVVATKHNHLYHKHAKGEFFFEFLAHVSRLKRWKLPCVEGEGEGSSGGMCQAPRRLTLFNLASWFWRIGQFVWPKLAVARKLHHCRRKHKQPAKWPKHFDDFDCSKLSGFTKFGFGTIFQRLKERSFSKLGVYDQVSISSCKINCTYYQLIPCFQKVRQSSLPSRWKK